MKTHLILTNIWGSSIMAVLMYEHDVTWAFWVFIALLTTNFVTFLLTDD